MPSRARRAPKGSRRSSRRPTDAHGETTSRGPTSMATQTRPSAESAERRSQHGLEHQGLDPRGAVHWNFVAPELVQDAIRRGEGDLADMGPLVAVTAPHTGRSPNDKFVVRQSPSERDVDWGKVNQPFPPEKFELLLE